MKVVHLNKDLETVKELAADFAKRWNEKYKVKAQKKYMKYGAKGKQNKAIKPGEDSAI